MLSFFAGSVYRQHTMVGVAQLVSASVCGTEGRGFDSHHPPQLAGFAAISYVML